VFGISEQRACHGTSGVNHSAQMRVIKV
jgi:hypothetical protein